MDALTARELLRYNIRMFDHPVKLERLADGRIRFEFKGADHHRTFPARTPARELLEGLLHLGTYYDHGSGQLHF